MYKACIFDLDGTLTDTVESLTYSVNMTLKELGFGEITPEQCKAFVGSGARRLLERALIASGDTDAFRIEEAVEVYKRVFQIYCTYKVEPYPGIRKLLCDLKDMGVKLSVLSNKPHERTIDVVNTIFGEDVFCFVYGQQDGVPRKPDPTALLQLLDEMGVEKKECLYLGDSDVDMKTGFAAGVDTVGVSWGFRSKEVLKENQATYIVDRAEEIISIVRE